MCEKFCLIVIQKCDYHNKARFSFTLIKLAFREEKKNCEKQHVCRYLLLKYFDKFGLPFEPMTYFGFIKNAYKLWYIAKERARERVRGAREKREEKG